MEEEMGTMHYKSRNAKTAGNQQTLGERPRTHPPSEPPEGAGPARPLDRVHTSSSLGCEGINACCFQVPGLWPLATAAPGNKDSLSPGWLSVLPSLPVVTCRLADVSDFIDRWDKADATTWDFLSYVMSRGFHLGRSLTILRQPCCEPALD